MPSMMAGVLIVSLVTTAAGPFSGRHRRGGNVTPPVGGDGAGFPNGNPDGYGYIDYRDTLPLGADRTPEYFFPRYHAMLPSQMFMPTYYNPYANRGQRYLAYTGCSSTAMHPAGGAPPGSARTPVHSYQTSVGSGPLQPVPTLGGRVEAQPVPSGGSGLTP